jgi:signal transduction histidine kinase
LDEAMLENAHIREISALCEPLFGDHGVWSRMIEFVSGATEARGTWYEKLERSDGSVLGMAGTVLPDGATMFGFTDVTDSIHKERVLREQNDKLEELSGLKSAFLDGIHGASNELKIPLNTIIGFSEILGQEYFGALNEQQREYIEGVGTAAADLRTLVSNITDLAMIQADDFPFQLEQIDLKPVIEATVRFIERSGTGTISLKLDCPDTIGEVPGDSPRFREILHNLINAVHGDLEEGAVIEVGVRRQERMMLLWIGAEDAALSGSTWQLLDSATQGLDAPPVQREGLGVTLARQFVERQGGTVGVERGIGLTKEAIVCRFLTDEASVRAAIDNKRSPRPGPAALPSDWEDAGDTVRA